MCWLFFWGGRGSPLVYHVIPNNLNDVSFFLTGRGDGEAIGKRNQKSSMQKMTFSKNMV